MTLTWDKTWDSGPQIERRANSIECVKVDRILFITMKALH